MATTLEELVVKISADVEGLKKDMTEAQRATAAATDRMAKSMEGMSKDSEKSLLSLNRILETTAGVFAGEALLGAIRGAGEAVAGFFKTLVVDSVQAAQESEAATARLNQALAQSGRYSKQASDSFKEFASSLQSTTSFEDDAIVSAGALIQTLGQLDEDGLKKATTAALDLSAALGVDLNTAAMLVGKAAAGEVGSFGRYGIAIEEGATKAETFARALDALQSRFGGSAQTQVMTFAGATEQLKNAFGDFQEEVGAVFTQNSALSAVLVEVKEIFEDLGGLVQENRDYLQGLVKDGIIYLAEAIPLVVDGVHTLSNSLTEAKKGIAALAGGLAELVGADEFAKAQEEAFIQEVEIQNKRDALFAKIRKGAEDVRDRIVAAAEDGAKGQDALNARLEAQSKIAAQSKAAIGELTAAQIEMGEAGLKLAEDLTGPNPTEGYKMQLEELALLREGHLISTEEYYAREKDLFAKKLADEQAMLGAALGQNKLGEEQYQAAVTELHNRAAQDRRKAAMKESQDTLKANQERLGYASQFFGDLGSMTRSKNKDLFEAGKAFAKAQALVDGYAAVQKTLASVPYPFSIPLAVAVGAKTAMNVAAINAQGFKTGLDEVPGIGTQDQFPALLAPKEGVIDAKTNPKLKHMAENFGELAPLLQAIYGALNRMNPSVTVNVGNKTLVDIIRDEIRSGREVFA